MPSYYALAWMVGFTIMGVAFLFVALLIEPFFYLPAGITFAGIPTLWVGDKLDQRRLKRDPLL